MTVSCFQIDDKLFELQKACNRYKETDPLANFVLYAVSDYLMSNKATRQFEKDFVNYPTDKLEELIRKCLNGDRSHDGDGKVLCYARKSKIFLLK